MKYRYIVITLLFFIPVLTHAVSGERASFSEEDKGAMRPDQITWDHVEELLNFMNLELTEKEIVKENRLLEARQNEDYSILQRLDSIKQRTYSGVAGHQLKGFGPEAAIFYAAIGGNMVVGSYINSITKEGRSDPRWMENLLYEMTSPVGVFSFFCFVMASGQTNLLYSRLLSPGWDVHFKRGPFKGRRIIKTKPLFSPGILQPRLDLLRRKATSQRLLKEYGASGTPHTSFRTALRYQKARFGPKLGLSFAGPLGMSVGMLASNIVHELDYIRLYNPHVGPCWDSFTGKEGVIDEADMKLHCDLFWDGMGSTIVSWAPGLASLVTASVISHAAVNAAYGLAGRAIEGAKHLRTRPFQMSQNILNNWAKRTGVRVPWKMLTSAASFIPTPATTGVKAGAKGLGLGIEAIAQWIKGFILPPGTQIVKGNRVNNKGFGSRFINLLAFMLTDTWITHDFYSAIWTETIKAGDVSDGMRDFITYSNVDSKICDRDDDCEYHESIFSAHETALTFDRWRQFRMEKAAASWQNWFKYVSSTTGSFEQIYYLYYLLFQAKRNKNNFHDVKYFGDLSEEALFSSDVGYAPKEGTARSFFEGMISQINEHIGKSNISKPSNVALDVVSDSPYHFLNPEISVSRNEGDRPFVLRSLFSVVDTRVPLEPFYGDHWGEALRQEEEKIYKYENPDRIIKEHFVYLEEITKDYMGTLLEKNSETNEDYEEIISDLKKYYTKILEPSIDLLEREMKGVPINSNGGTKLNNYVDEILSLYAERFNLLVESQPNDLDVNFSAFNFLIHWYFNDWLEQLALEKDKILSQGVLVDGAAVAERVANRLRKKILSAGLEYLNKIIEWEKKKYSGRYVNYIYSDLKDQIKNLPPEMIGVYQRLGTDNIFAQLYARTFVPNKTASKEDHPAENKAQKYIQIKPEAPGMFTVKTVNADYRLREDTFDVNYHPDRLLGLRTKGFMDFVIASAVCGPDPMEIAKPTEEQMNGLLSNNEDKFLKELKELMDSVPLFSSFIGMDWIAGKGASYAFYPPRITTLDEKTRKAICRDLYSRSGIVKDLYNGHFPVGDRVYNNLLHLVLDHIGFKDGETQVSSLEDFVEWWNEKISLYMTFFQIASDQEYKRIVKHDFMGPLFMKDIEDTTMTSYLLQTDFSKLDFSGSSEWDNISLLSHGGFIKKGPRIHNHYDSRVGVARPRRVYNVSLPKGVFQSMHFEALYWSDMILHFARKKGLSDENRGKLRGALKQFAEEFNISEECSFSEDVSLWSVEQMACHIKWAKGFLKNGGKLQYLNNLLEVDVNNALDISVELLIERANPDDPDNQTFSLSQEEQKEQRERAISAFKCEPEAEGCDLPLQLINFFIIRLNQILTEATTYADQVGYISEHPDVKEINTPSFQ
ncbi:MAG: hypothetical protein OXM55_06600 [Bdellovibrionales bacterium]|nr:hypothetical protein [Bdellovibrionales bacterium]